MVEFGLKLLDNRVSDWKSYYIDYDKLKALLKQAKETEKRKKELEKKDPALAEHVKLLYEEELKNPPTTTTPSMSRSTSANSLHEVASVQSEDDVGANGAELPIARGFFDFVGALTKGAEQHFAKITEAKTGSYDQDYNANVEVNKTSKPESIEEAPLLAMENLKIHDLKPPALDELPTKVATGYGSIENDSPRRPYRRMDSSGFPTDTTCQMPQTESSSSLAQRVAGLFTKTRHTDRLKEAYRDCDKAKSRFEDRLLKELRKVDQFYIEKTKELTERLKVLVASVDVPEPTDEDSRAVAAAPNADTDQIVGAKVGTKLFQLLHNVRQKNHRRVGSLTGKIAPHRRHMTDTSTIYESLIHAESDNSDNDESHQQSERSGHRRGKKMRHAEADSIKRELTDLYRRAKLLSNFSIMNYTGFVKVVKKHDKNLPDDKKKFKKLFEGASFQYGTEAEQLCTRMEKIYAAWFGGNHREAAAQMLPKKGDGLDMDWSQLRLGFRLGMCNILLMWVCWDCIWGRVKDGNSTIGGRTAFPVFRACGGLLIWHWFWGLSVYIWSRYRVNYIFLFDFDPRNVDTPVQIFNDCVDESLVFLICMLLYYKAGVGDIPEIIPPGGYPFILVLFTIKALVLPRNKKKPLWTAIWQVVTSPIKSPTFFHIYVGDVFTSMVKVFQDILWSACFIISGDFLLAEEDIVNMNGKYWHRAVWYKNFAIPFICLLPLWFRFSQCLRRYFDTRSRLPHLANAGKYALSQTVTLFGAFHPLYMYMVHDNNRNGHNLFQFFWILLFVASSLYSFFWDVYMDWGLGRLEYGFLGPRLMYPNRFYYYGVICADFGLRFMWVLTLVPPQSGAKFELPAYLTFMTMSVELLRRMLWGSFRLEQEHRHNTEGYRRVDFVPLHFTTGHDHKYKAMNQKDGRHVLAEVLIIASVVILLSASSVIAAQRSKLEDAHEL